MKKLIFTAILGSLVFSCPFNSGAEANYPVGARPFSMGNAFVGQADDACAIFINPAGLSQLGSFNLQGSISHLGSGFDFSSFAAARPGPFGGVVGIGYQSNFLSNTLISGEILSYSEQEFHVAYSKMIRDNLALGANVRHIEYGYSKDFPWLHGSIGSGAAADFSLKYLYQPWLNLGFAAQNIGKKMQYADGTENAFPLNLVFGLNYKILGENGYYARGGQELAANFDLSREGNSSILMHLGFEWSPLKNVLLRLGTEQTARTPQYTDTNITGGIGMKLGEITIDYAIYNSGDPSRGTTYFYSLGYVESLEPLSAELDKVVVTASPSPEPVVVRAIKRSHFSDVPAGYWAKDPIELLASAELIDGYADGNFRPEETVSREGFCVMLVHAKHLAPPAVKTMLDLGAIMLYPDQTFKPERSISRAESVYALAILDKLTIPATIEKSSFVDVLPSSWPAPAIEASLKAGILAKDKYFYPDQPLTRAALSQMIFNTSFGKAAVKRLPRLED